MPGHESTETGSDGLVIALGPKQLACVLAVARSGGSRSPFDRASDAFMTTPIVPDHPDWLIRVSRYTRGNRKYHQAMPGVGLDGTRPTDDPDAQRSRRRGGRIGHRSGRAPDLTYPRASLRIGFVDSHERRSAIPRVSS